MGLTIPLVSVTAGPTWATQLAADLSLLENHDHTSGKGSAILSAAIWINADLSFNNSYNLTNPRSVRLAGQTSTLTGASDLGCLYATGGNLYYNNGQGSPIQLTSGSAINVSSVGGITGMVSPASAAFASGPGTFTFQSGVNIAATMDSGPLVTRDTTDSARGITIKSPAALAAAYSLTLPAVLPGTKKILAVDATGAVDATYDVDNSTLAIANNALKVKDLGVGTAQLAALGVTRAKLASLGQQTANPGTVGKTSTTYDAVAGLAVSLVATGRPIIVACVSDTGLVGGFTLYLAAAGGDGFANVRLAVTGSATTTIAETTMRSVWPSSSSGFAKYPPSVLWTFYAPGATGTYIFQVEAKIDGTVVTRLDCASLRLVAYEL